MYPLLFRIAGFEITSFGAMVGIATLVGAWIFQRELRRSGLPADAVDAAIAGVLGGLVGAKVIWVVEHAAMAPIPDLLFSRAGLSWFGGLAGGLLSGLVVMHRRHVPKTAVLAAATPALAIGHAIGRIGCFLVGDDYGTPTTRPWGVAFPEGLPPTTVPVHPTQLYEMAALLLLAWLLIRWRRQHVLDHVVLGRYLIAAGAIRFLVEILRVHVRVLGPLAVAQFFAFAAIAGGIVMLRSRPHRRRASGSRGVTHPRRP